MKTPAIKSSLPFLALMTIVLTSCDNDQVLLREPRLQYYIEHFNVEGLEFEPQLKVTYEYNWDGKVRRYKVLSYNPDTKSLEEQRRFNFTWSNGKLVHLKGYLPGKSAPYIEYEYTYQPDGNVSRITEDNHGAGISSSATFDYAEDGTVKVSYDFSNGGAFQYEFDIATGNILSDKTTRGAQLCSTGEYTYDDQKNPFHDLGYIDYFLSNLSSNNKLTENVNYVGCAFPTLIAESYSYEYDDRGYPVSATTTYKSDGSLKQSRKDFVYAKP